MATIVTAKRSLLQLLKEKIEQDIYDVVIDKIVKEQSRRN